MASSVPTNAPNRLNSPRISVAAKIDCCDHDAGNYQQPENIVRPPSLSKESQRVGEWICSHFLALLTNAISMGTRNSNATVEAPGLSESSRVGSDCLEPALYH